MKAMTAPGCSEAAIAAIRHFNRFYTRQIGLLNEKLLKSAFKLTEARVLHDLAQHATPLSLTRLSDELLIDPGYLSRILKAFEANGLVARSASVRRNWGSHAIQFLAYASVPEARFGGPFGVKAALSWQFLYGDSAAPVQHSNAAIESPLTQWRQYGLAW